jgi:hypothetical protein
VPLLDEGVVSPLDEGVFMEPGEVPFDGVEGVCW